MEQNALRMQLKLLENRVDCGYVTFGSVWDKGEVKGGNFVLRNEKKECVPVQSRITAFWPDGSVKWAAHTADALRMGRQAVIEPAEETAVLPGTGNGIKIERRPDGIYVETSFLAFVIPMDKSSLLHSLRINGREMVRRAYPVIWLEHFLQEKDTHVIREECFGYGKWDEMAIEEEGPLQCVFRFSGKHVESRYDRRVMPFICRIYVNADSDTLKFVHTFIYDGDKDHDLLKGMGIRFEAEFQGRHYDRHIRFGTEGTGFHEAAVLLSPSHPRLPAEVFRSQMEGRTGAYPQYSEEDRSADDMPVWSDYGICQDSSEHYRIYKRTKENCCYLDCRHGRRANGVMMAGGANGALLIGIRDFWKRYPGGLEAHGMEKEVTECTAWFYSPQASCFDFRHYDTRTYPRTCYEGYPELGDDPKGIAVTGECSLKLMEKIASDEETRSFGTAVSRPPIYAGEPSWYHEKRAFGFWSLPKMENQAWEWAEKQLESAFSFYKEEVDARKWYGLFDYGDIMHTYDSVRHVWKYDMGGFAWQNTELVPTYWFWLYFLRTGREDVFSMAEAMSRHCSETDMYHTGLLKGMGSRHNVRHWGCPCKEPRISMAGHWRFYYYLTGDHRMGEVMDEVKDAENALRNVKHYQEDGRLVIRSGPDWSSYVANWMTRYERTLDEKYLYKIKQGIRDIAAAPYGLASGPDFEFDTDMSHLIYHGENENTPNQHLQICMGGLQIWLECAWMLESSTLKRLLEELGCFYLLSPEEKKALTGGKIEKRPFGWPMLASGLVAYAAMRRRDRNLALQAWELLFREIDVKFGATGIETRTYGQKPDGLPQKEIPGVMTNTVSQWCLNMIMCLEFIPEELEEVYDRWKAGH